MDEPTRQDFLSELCPQLRPIVARVMECSCGCETLDFFRNRRHTWLAVSDISHHLRVPSDQVIRAMEQLTDLGLLDRRDVLGNSYYALTQKPETLDRLDQFWVWRDDWYERWQRVRGALKLDTNNAPIGPI